MAMEFLTEYAFFLAKLATVVILVFLLLGGVVFVVSRARDSGETRLVVKSLNDKYEKFGLMLNAAILPRKEFRKALKNRKLQQKRKQKRVKQSDACKNIFVLTFKGDIWASEVISVRESITAILTVATPSDEVVVILESLGGTLHGYGLAASQLRRIRDKGVQLTVAVDKVAASGGYMMACVADNIIAAPFAIIGSIGVIGQLPNFNRVLKNLDIEQVTAGEFKRSLSLFGENTEKGREKFREDIENSHRLFKEFVVKNREKVNIDEVSTGEHWYGQQALDLKLVDELRTSDDYLHETAQSANLYEVSFIRKKSWPEKLLPFYQSSQGCFDD